MKTKQLTVQISEKMINDFTQKCKEREVTKAEIVRACIRNFLKK